MDLHSVLLNLSNITTFKLACPVSVFRIKNELDLYEYFQKNNKEFFVLGGGSNIIASPDLSNKDILKIEIMGKEIIREEGDDIYIKVGAGENWDSVVEWAVSNGFSGIEALSAIPGSAGATPVQNVGAYGAEIKDVFVSLSAYDIQKKELVTLQKEDCNFTYRQSIFKSSQKGKYIITNIVLKLSKKDPIMPDYPGVKSYFEEHEIQNPSLNQIRDAIIEIRWSKLPHPEEIGNCGSFFENPIVDADFYEVLKSNYPDIKAYILDGGRVKIPAGWLLEKSGLKGVNFGPVGTYEKNALVIINNGDAQYQDVVNAKNQIINTVKEKFGIELKTEPEFV